MVGVKGTGEVVVAVGGEDAVESIVEVGGEGESTGALEVKDAVEVAHKVEG